MNSQAKVQFTSYTNLGARLEWAPALVALVNANILTTDEARRVLGATESPNGIAIDGIPLRHWHCSDQPCGASGHIISKFFAYCPVCAKAASLD